MQLINETFAVEDVVSSGDDDLQSIATLVWPLPTAFSADNNDSESAVGSSISAAVDVASLNRTPPVVHVEQTIENFLATFVMPLIIAVGTFGNVTSLAVLLRRRMRRTSVYLYLTALAVADFSVLYVSAFKTWIRLMSGFELMHISSAVCSTITFLLLVSFNLSAWLIVLTTVDRFVAVWLPLHAATVCSRRRALFAILLLTAVILLANVHVFWTTGLESRHPRPGFYCGPPRDSVFMHGPFEYIKLMSYCVVPFVLILTLNGAIVARLSCRHRGGILRQTDDGPTMTAGAVRTTVCRNVMTATTTSHQAPHQQTSSSTAKVTYMLLAVSVTWLVLTAPWTLMSLIGQVDLEDSRAVARYRLLRTTSWQLVYINHAVNFYLYCITGRKFRRELRDMFVAVCCRPLMKRVRCCCWWCCCGSACQGLCVDGKRAGGGPEAISFVSRNKNAVSGVESRSRSVRTYMTQTQRVNVDTAL